MRSFLKFKYCLKVKAEIDDWFFKAVSVSETTSRSKITYALSESVGAESSCIMLNFI